MYRIRIKSNFSLLTVQSWLYVLISIGFVTTHPFLSPMSSLKKVASSSFGLRKVFLEVVENNADMLGVCPLRFARRIVNMLTANETLMWDVRWEMGDFKTQRMTVDRRLCEKCWLVLRAKTDGNDCVPLSQGSLRVESPRLELLHFCNVTRGHHHTSTVLSWWDETQTQTWAAEFLSYT